MIFSWDDWNTDHIAEHGVDEGEAEYVVTHARPPFPREIGDEKYLVWGRSREGRYLQVVFVYRSPGEVDYESIGLPELLELTEESAGRGVYRPCHGVDPENEEAVPKAVGEAM